MTQHFFLILIQENNRVISSGIKMFYTTEINFGTFFQTFFKTSYIFQN